MFEWADIDNLLIFYCNVGIKELAGIDVDNSSPLSKRSAISLSERKEGFTQSLSPVISLPGSAWLFLMRENSIQSSSKGARKNSIRSRKRPKKRTINNATKTLFEMDFLGPGALFFPVSLLRHGNFQLFSET